MKKIIGCSLLLLLGMAQQDSTHENQLSQTHHLRKISRFSMAFTDDNVNVNVEVSNNNQNQNSQDIQKTVQIKQVPHGVIILSKSEKPIDKSFIVKNDGDSQISGNLSDKIDKFKNLRVDEENYTEPEIISDIVREQSQINLQQDNIQQGQQHLIQTLNPLPLPTMSEDPISNQTPVYNSDYPSLSDFMNPPSPQQLDQQQQYQQQQQTQRQYP